MKCSICGEDKSIDNFYFRKDRNTYRKNCKSCCNKTNKKHYLENKDKVRESNKNWRINNKEKSDAIYAKYRKTDKRKKVANRWARNNREQTYKYRNNKYNTDPEYNLNIKIRRRIYMALRSQHARKNFKTINILGCDYLFLKEYIENKFSEGMTWDLVLNGKIHLDHIKPISSFNLLNKGELNEAFHYTNLQPLWAEENLAKYNKII